MSNSLAKRFWINSQDTYTVLWSDLLILRSRSGRYLITTTISLLLGKALIGVVRGLVSSIAFIAASLLLAPGFRVGPLFLMELLLTGLVFSFLGVLAALPARSHQDLATFSSLILLPMTFLGGTFFPLTQVPWGLKLALYALPLTHCSICLRAAALDQPVPWGSLLAIIFFLMVFFSGCMVVLKRISV